MPYDTNRRRHYKAILVACLGGKCNKCGYNKYFGALDFHHLHDKKDWIHSLTRTLRNWRLIIEECKKCILLCKNCHHELHAGLWSLTEIDIVQFDDKHLSWKYRSRWKPCAACGKVFFVREEAAGCCSRECAARLRRKTVRPSDTELQELLWSKPTTQIAKSLGVSDKTVEKWARHSGLTKPGPGHWTKIGKTTQIQELTNGLLVQRDDASFARRKSGFDSPTVH